MAPRKADGFGKVPVAGKNSKKPVRSQQRLKQTKEMQSAAGEDLKPPPVSPKQGDAKPSMESEAESDAESEDDCEDSSMEIVKPRGWLITWRWLVLTLQEKQQLLKQSVQPRAKPTMLPAQQKSRRHQ